MTLSLWDKGNPIEGVPARQINNDIRDNNADVETFADFGHEFVSLSQTGEHREGSAVIFAGATQPPNKEDGTTPLDSGDVGRRLWYDTTTTPAILKVMTAFSTNVFTSVATLIGMIDDDTMATASDVLPASSESIKAYVDGLDGSNLKEDGSVVMSGALDMDGAAKIIGVVDPTSAQDVATMAYVDAQSFVEVDIDTYTGDQGSNNDSDMTAAQTITTGFQPNEVTIISENDSRHTFAKFSSMGLTDAKDVANNDFSDLLIEFIATGFKVNRRSSTLNCNESSEVYHYIAKRHY